MYFLIVKFISKWAGLYVLVMQLYFKGNLVDESITNMEMWLQIKT